MRKLLLALLCLIALPATASHWRSIGTLASCPYQTWIATDGCTGAPAYINSTLSYQNANGLTSGLTGSWFQSGQAIPSRSIINWNVAGQEYPVGVASSQSYCSLAGLPCSGTPGAGNLIDAHALTKAQWQTLTGCPSVDATALASNTILCTIGSATHLIFNGIDFSPNDSGTQYCYNVYLSNESGNGTLDVTNNRKVTQYSLGCGGFPGTVDIYHEFKISTSVSHTWNANVLNNWFDGGSAGTTGHFINDTFFEFDGNGALVVEYNYFANTNEKMISTVACGSVDIRFNVFHNLGYDVGVYGASAHQEWEIVGPGSASCPSPVTVNNRVGNTAWQDASLPGPQGVIFFDTPLFNAAYGPGYISGGVSSYVVTNGVMELNTLISNYSQDQRVNSTANCTTSPNLCRNWHLQGNASNLGSPPGSGYSAGDIIALSSTPSGCNAQMNGTYVAPTYLVYAVTNTPAPGTPTQIYEWNAGVCGTTDPGVSSNQATSCVGHADNTTGIITNSCSGSGATISTVGWANSSISQMYALTANPGDPIPYTNLFFDYNFFDPAGTNNKTAWSLMLQLNAPLNCANSQGAQNHNYSNYDQLYHDLSSYSTYVDANCYR